MGHIVKHRHSSLPSLNHYIRAEKNIWLAYKDWFFHKTVDHYLKKIAKQEKSLEDEPDWCLPAIYVGELMLS
jgi:hypothetical protein